LLSVVADHPIIQAALLAGVLTSTGSWPTILTNGKQSPWFVRTAWYCGIILSLLSIISAADQTVRLHRLSSHRDGLANIHKLLAKSSTVRRTGRRAPSLLQIMTWQMPVMFLITSTICMVVGMFLLVWSATSNLGTLRMWDDQNKVSLPIDRSGIPRVLMRFAGCSCLYIGSHFLHPIVLCRADHIVFTHTAVKDQRSYIRACQDKRRNNLGHACKELYREHHLGLFTLRNEGEAWLIARRRSLKKDVLVGNLI
jgi:hypothetical protein